MGVALGEQFLLVASQVYAGNAHVAARRGVAMVSVMMGQDPRCRLASYRHTPLATDTFRLSTAPIIGMRTN